MPTAKTALAGDAVSLAGFQFLLPLPSPSLHPKQKKIKMYQSSIGKQEGGTREVTTWVQHSWGWLLWTV